MLNLLTSKIQQLLYFMHKTSYTKNKAKIVPCETHIDLFFTFSNFCMFNGLILRFLGLFIRAPFLSNYIMQRKIPKFWKFA